MSLKKYILVSQGIKIFETYNKEEAQNIMDKENNEWIKYVKKCIENDEPYTDNEISMYLEQ